MDWSLVKALNLLGIVLEFLSFWFAAPEILGERRLRAIERRLEKGIEKSPLTLLWVAMVAALALMWVVTMAMCWVTLRLMLVGMTPVDVLANVLAVVVMALLPMCVLSAALTVAIKLQEKVVPPLLRVLADDERIRQRSLVVGAVLFMIAFLCQFTAALLDIW
jgi:hypothetical protein